MRLAPVDGLPGERTAAPVRDGDRDHDGEPHPARFEHLLDGHERRFGVQRVEDGLNQQHVDPAVEEALYLLGVRVPDLVEGDGAERRVVHVGRERQRAIRRADGARDEPRPVGRAGRPRSGGFARQPGRRDVQLVDERLKVVVGLRDRVAAEGVGLDDVAAGSEVLVVDLPDDVGAGEDQELVVALHVVPVLAKALAAVVRFAELATLDHRAHCAVEDEDATGQQRFQAGLRISGHVVSRSGGPACGRRA